MSLTIRKWLLDELGIDSFMFRRNYSGLYTNKDAQFVLREEHVADLKRLTDEFNRHRHADAAPLSMSDLVNSCLDLMLAHPLDLKGMRDSEAVRNVIAKEVYRKAFLKFHEAYEV